MTIMMHVVGLQLQTLEDLRRIFRNSWKICDADKGYDRNVVRIPFVDKEECVTLILRVLDEAMEERRGFKMAFEEWTRWGQSLTDYLENRPGEAAAAVEAQKQQAKIQEQILADIKQQAQTMSWFTAVTALFLPLTFFTSYFAIDWSKGFPHNDGDFWKVSAPFTFAFMYVTLYVIFRKKVEAGEIKKMEVRFLEKIKKVGFTKRVRENATAPGGKSAETGVIRTVWNKAMGGKELAARNMSYSTAEKGESSQGVAGYETPTPQ